jgi:hypothetical protein
MTNKSLQSVVDLTVEGNASVECWLAVGTDDPLNRECGDTTTKRIIAGTDVPLDGSTLPFEIDPLAGPTPRAALLGAIIDDVGSGTYSYLTLIPTTSPHTESHIATGSNLVLGPLDGPAISYTNTQQGVRSGIIMANPGANYTSLLHYRSRGVHYNSSTINTIISFLSDTLVIQPGSSTTAGTITGFHAVPVTTVSGALPSTVNIIRAFRASPSILAGVTTITSNIGFEWTAGGDGSNLNVGFRGSEATAGTFRAIVQFNTNSVGCGAGLAAGTSFDTCFYRGRAGAWTGPSGTDFLSDSGFFCGGTGCSSLSPSSVGIYDSGVRTVRSCTPGPGIASCTVTDGDLAVAASPASLPSDATFDTLLVTEETTLQGGTEFSFEVNQNRMRFRYTGGSSGSDAVLVCDELTCDFGDEPGDTTVDVRIYGQLFPSFGVASPLYLSSGSVPTVTFDTGACTGGSTAPAETVTGAGGAFFLRIVTGDGACGGGGAPGTATVATIDLQQTFPTKAICVLSNAAQNQGADGGPVNVEMECVASTCTMETFTTATNLNNFLPSFAYQWNVLCGGF